LDLKRRKPHGGVPAGNVTSILSITPVVVVKNCISYIAVELTRSVDLNVAGPSRAAWMIGEESVDGAVVDADISGTDKLL
jgi:hypothetical protein